MSPVRDRMRRMLLRRRLFVPAIALLLTGAGALAQQPPQTLPSVRVRIAMVPVDVRIVDRQGNPVTDLKQEDFTLLEDGVPQDIRHFSTQTLAADPAARDAGLALRRAPGADVAPANKRVFLVMLGRGRHQPVVGGVDALSAFVRERLLPQDRIALMAWNRATDFTTDHALIARTVARYGEASRGDRSGSQGVVQRAACDLRIENHSIAHPAPHRRGLCGSRQPAAARDWCPASSRMRTRLRNDLRRTADDLMTVAIERPGGRRTRS